MEKLMKEQRIKIILAGILVVLLALTLWFSLKPKDSTKKIAKTEKEMFAHTDKEIIKEEQLDDLKFSNVTLITENGYTTFSCDVTNSKDEEVNVENVNIELKDKDGNTVITLLGNIGSSLKPNETRVITASAKGEFKNVVSKTIVHVS
ncbi:MAG: FxLYD domain-containing protein [Bacilli bacterium]|nr:FxLYD domain-containing protein [Bacilli bacterium]